MTRNTRQEETIIRLSPPSPPPPPPPSPESDPRILPRDLGLGETGVGRCHGGRTQDEIIFSCFFLLVFYCWCLGRVLVSS